MKLKLVCGVVALICSVGTTNATEVLEPEFVSSYGGVYSTNCGDSNAENIEITKDKISVGTTAGSKVFKDLMTDLSFYGRSPPKNFENAVIAKDLSFAIYKNAKGVYLKDVDSSVLPKTLGKKQFLFCGKTKSTPVTNTTPSPGQTSAYTDLTPKYILGGDPGTDPCVHYLDADFKNKNPRPIAVSTPDGNGLVFNLDSHPVTVKGVATSKGFNGALGSLKVSISYGTAKSCGMECSRIKTTINLDDGVKQTTTKGFLWCQV